MVLYIKKANLAINGTAMKCFITLFVFVFAALLVQAQTTNPTLYTYKQKQLNDTLQMLFPDLQSSGEIPVQNNMPVLQLKSDGVKVGSNELGEIYSMKVDNMPCLKPFKTKDAIPNAIQQKPLVLAAPPKK